MWHTIIHFLDMVTNPWANLFITDRYFRKVLVLGAISVWGAYTIFLIGKKLSIDVYQAITLISNHEATLSITVYALLVILHGLYTLWVIVVITREHFIAGKETSEK